MQTRKPLFIEYLHKSQLEGIQVNYNGEVFVFSAGAIYRKPISNPNTQKNIPEATYDIVPNDGSISLVITWREGNISQTYKLLVTLSPINKETDRGVIILQQ